MLQIDKAHASVSSVITHSSVVLLAHLFRDVINPGLLSSSSVGNGFFAVRRKEVAERFGDECLFNTKDLRVDAWRIFSYLTLDPLADTKKYRCINASNTDCISESLGQIRRMLLVKSENNSRNLFSTIQRSSVTFSDTVKSAEDFQRLSFEEQFKLSAEFYFQLLRCIIIEHPGVVQVQIQSDRQSQFRLTVWGNFKMK